MRIMITRAEAEMMRAALEESGWVCCTRPAMAEARVARERRMSRIPIDQEPTFSTLGNCELQQRW
jgi:hypothetical protein